MKTRIKLLIGAISALVAVLVFAGVAYGANGATPGDSLYGLDRALEKVGLGAGGLEERLSEAGELMDEGRVEEALKHAAEAVLANGSERSLEVRTRVAEKLRWMATTELTGKEFGQAVSALARGISPGEEEDGQGGPAAGKGSGVDKDKKNNGKAQGHNR